MEYKRIQGKVISKRALEARKFIDKEATSTLDERIRNLGGIVCKGRPPSGYKQIGGPFSKKLYIPDNVSLDGCMSVATSFSKESDKEFEISLDVTSQQTRGERVYFPTLKEDVVVYVCDPKVAEFVDKTLEKLTLQNPDAKSNLEKVREALG